MVQRHGRGGHEINFSPYFYHYTRSWPLEALEVDIRAVVTSLDRETGKVDGLIAKIREAVKRFKEFSPTLTPVAATGKNDVREEVA